MTVAQKQAKTNSNRRAADTRQNSGQNPLAHIADTRQEAIAQKELMDGFHNSPRMVAQRKQLEGYSEGNFAAHDMAQPQQEIKPKPNETGLPDNLKSGIEALSGFSMDNVRVHYNSPKPAQINALAYAQGTDIHLAPRQERHLPHEAWHVVQQAQGRVQPTIQKRGGILVNSDASLEHEANVMGDIITKNDIGNLNLVKPCVRKAYIGHENSDSLNNHPSGTLSRQAEPINSQISPKRQKQPITGLPSKTGSIFQYVKVNVIPEQTQYVNNQVPELLAPVKDNLVAYIKELISVKKKHAVEMEAIQVPPQPIFDETINATKELLEVVNYAIENSKNRLKKWDHICDKLRSLSTKSSEDIESEARATGIQLGQEMEYKKLQAKRSSYFYLNEKMNQIYSILDETDDFFAGYKPISGHEVSWHLDNIKAYKDAAKQHHLNLKNTKNIKIIPIEAANVTYYLEYAKKEISTHLPVYLDNQGFIDPNERTNRSEAKYRRTQDEWLTQWGFISGARTYSYRPPINNTISVTDINNQNNLFSFHFTINRSDINPTAIVSSKNQDELNGLFTFYHLTIERYAPSHEDNPHFYFINRNHEGQLMRWDKEGDEAWNEKKRIRDNSITPKNNEFKIRIDDWVNRADT